MALLYLVKTRHSNSAALAEPHMARAVRLVRRMRGGTQAILVEADDGCRYVLKFRNNPQHRRVLINEWLTIGLFRSVGISTPAAAMIEVPQDLLDANPLACFNVGANAWPPTPGIHFGSRYPDAGGAAVYDFLPRILLKGLRNQSDFVGALVVDLWLAHADNRQAVFYRGEKRDGEVLAPFTAAMIDNGYCLGGTEWKLNRKIAPLHLDRSVYEPCWTEEAIEFWISRLEQIPEALIGGLAAAIPGDWLAEDRTTLENLLGELIRRRSLVSELIDRNIVQSGLLPPPRVRRFPVARASRKAKRQMSVA